MKNPKQKITPSVSTKPAYSQPTITTYGAAELLRQLGPARATSPIHNSNPEDGLLFGTEFE
jgi:hypothetical protein